MLDDYGTAKMRHRRVDGGCGGATTRLWGSHGGFPRSDRVTTTHAGAGGDFGRLWARVGMLGSGYVI